MPSRPEMNQWVRSLVSHKYADAAHLKARLATEVPVATGGVYLQSVFKDKENLVPIAKHRKIWASNYMQTPHCRCIGER